MNTPLIKSTDLDQKYTNPESPYYVEEHLRPAYESARGLAARNFSPTNTTWLTNATLNASSFAAAAVTRKYGVYPRRIPGSIFATHHSDEERQANDAWHKYGEQFFTEVETEKQRLLSDITLLIELSLHSTALDRARRHHARDLKSQRAQKAAEENNTCPICGTVALKPAAGYPVKSRPRWADHTAYGAEEIRSCAHCFTEVRRQDAENAAAAPTPTRKSRRQAVTAWLASK